MSQNWYVVSAKTGHEDCAAANLRRQEFEIFLPRAFRAVRHARQIKNSVLAFFPGYFFVRFDVDRDRWRSIEGSRGVRGLIKANDRPLPAPDTVVDALKSACGADGIVDCARELAVSDHVRVNAGPFAGQLAVVASLRASDRVEILLSLMRQVVPVEVHRRDLALIS